MRHRWTGLALCLLASTAAAAPAANAWVREPVALATEAGTERVIELVLPEAWSWGYPVVIVLGPAGPGDARRAQLRELAREWGLATVELPVGLSPEERAQLASRIGEQFGSERIAVFEVDGNGALRPAALPDVLAEREGEWLAGALATLVAHADQ